MSANSLKAGFLRMAWKGRESRLLAGSTHSALAASSCERRSRRANTSFSGSGITAVLSGLGEKGTVEG